MQLSGEYRLMMPPKSNGKVAAIFSAGGTAASSSGTPETPSEVSPGDLTVRRHHSTGIVDELSDLQRDD